MPVRDHLFIGYACRDEVFSSVAIPLETPPSAVHQFVQAATESLFEAFDGVQLSQSIIEDLTNRLSRDASKRSAQRRVPDMSYDIYLVPPAPGQEPLATAHARLNVETKEINPGPPNADAEARKQQLTRALTTENPALAPFEFGYAEIARIDGITEDEARVRYRHVELNGPENGNGIQITLYDDNASITIPYWHQPDAARVVFEEVRRYLRVLRESGGFFVYDPQLDRVIDLDADPRDMINEYGRVVAKVPEIIEQSQSQTTRPWWKLW